MGKFGPRERADRGEKGAGPRGLLGQERRGKAGPAWEKGLGWGLGRFGLVSGCWAGLRWFGPLSWMAYGFRLSCRFGFSNLFPFFFSISNTT